MCSSFVIAIHSVLTFEFVQNNNNAKSSFTLLKKNRDGFKSAKKKVAGDFSTVKRQGNCFGAFRKETGCHPASSRPTSSAGYKYVFSQMNIIGRVTGCLCITNVFSVYKKPALMA
jgi:hypothetical protein